MNQTSWTKIVYRFPPQPWSSLILFSLFCQKTLVCYPTTLVHIYSWYAINSLSPLVIFISFGLYPVFRQSLHASNFFTRLGL